MTPSFKGRALHVIDTSGPGGAETVLLELAHGLVARGWEPIVVVGDDAWLASQLRARGIVPLLVASQRSFDLVLLRQLMTTVKTECVKVIHAHLFGMGVYASLAGLLTGTPVIVTLHGEVDMNTNERFLWLKKLILNRSADRIVYVSDRLRDSFRSRGLRNAHNTVVIPNGIRTTTNSPDTRRRVRNELGINGDDVLVAGIGNLRPAKAYDVFVAAARSLAQSSEAYRFVIAGEGSTAARAALMELVDESGLQLRFTFLGFRTDVDSLLRAADVFLLSSRSEGFSLATLQAMNAGVPVVATRCGGPESIIEDGISGVLVPTGNADALAEAVRRVVFDKELRSRVIRNAHQVVQERFSLDCQLARYDALYEELIHNRPHRSKAELTCD